MKRTTLPDSNEPTADKPANSLGQPANSVASEQDALRQLTTGQRLEAEAVSPVPAALGTITARSKRVKRRLFSLSAPLAWLWLLVFCAGTGAAALVWLMSIPPLPDCKNAQSLSLDGEKLFCAEQAAQSGTVESLIAGLDLVKDWQVDHPLHSRATHLTDEWSTAVLDYAQRKALEADLQGAIAIAKKIPPSSTLYQEAKAAILTWEKDLRDGQTIVDAVETAIRAKNWAMATQRLRGLSRLQSDYWTLQLDRLRQRLSVERIAAEQLEQARRLAQSAPNDMQVLGRAIALAEQIMPDTYAHTASRSDIDQWMQSLFTIVTGQLSPHSDLEGATAAVQRLPRGVPVPDVRDILWFSRAQPLVTDKLPRGPLYEQLWRLWLVHSQVQQIPSTSPLSAQAQATLPKLKQQIQDVTQLNAASLLASLWQIPTFHAAIEIARGIAPDRPRRIYAQTLITMWQRDIERVVDRPYLMQAQQLATTGKPDDLKTAIAVARQIAPSRPLRSEAAMAIAQWTRQIQLIEDGPILAQAQRLAVQQLLSEAIQTAAQIRAGRALYPEAQAAIAGWSNQIQVAQDRPILDRANTLADQGNLTAAINLANQIGPGRALYGEAQRAIATWTAQETARRQPRLPQQETLEPELNEPMASPDALTSPSPAADPMVSPAPLPNPGATGTSPSTPYFSPYVKPSPVTPPPVPMVPRSPVPPPADSPAPNQPMPTTPQPSTNPADLPLP